MKKFLCLSLIFTLLFLTACAGTHEPADVENSAEPKETVSPAVESEDLYQGDEVVSTAEINYYSIFTNESKEAVEGFAATVKQQILDKDWAGLSENVVYPITVGGKTYANKSEFASADWDSILSAEFINSIKEESCENLFSNSDGAMLGNGEVWISEWLDSSNESMGLKVIAINA